MMQVTTKPEGAAEIVKLLTEFQQHIEQGESVEWAFSVSLATALRLEEAGIVKIRQADATRT